MPIPPASVQTDKDNSSFQIWNKTIGIIHGNLILWETIFSTNRDHLIILCQDSLPGPLCLGIFTHKDKLFHLVYSIHVDIQPSWTEDINCRLKAETFTNKGPSSLSYGFSSSHVWMWEMNYKETWALKNWCFWTVVLEKTLENPLDCKEIQPVHPKGDQSWMFIGRMDAEAETLILWPPDVKNWFIGKDPDAGKYWRWEEKGMTQDEMVGWLHQLHGHQF